MTPKRNIERNFKAYLIRDFQQTPHLDWLLRRFKGKFYRRRYPEISFAQERQTDAKSV